MRARVLAVLLGLRYRLLWAQVRTRNGRILLAAAAYLMLSVVAAILLLGGIGGAIASVRLGKAETVARVALTAPFLCVTLTAALFGVGMRQVFSDSFLRRYALHPIERLAARHLIAVLEPLWIVTLVWYIGLAAGFVLLDVAHWWTAIPAAVLLLTVNYLLARTFQSVTEYAIATRWGPLALLVLLTMLFPLPAVGGPMLVRNQAALGQALMVLQWTPPFAAAVAMAGGTAGSRVGGLLLLLGYCGVLTTAIAAMDRLPLPSRTVATAKVEWGDLWDRISGVFGPELGPLIGKILRYYARSPQLRFNYPVAAIGIVIISLDFGRGDPMHSFLKLLGAITAVGSLSMGAMTMNVFGFDGSGFRRYFLLPVAPARVLRAAAIVPLLLGSAIIPVSLGIWMAVSRVGLDARMVVMVVSNAVAAMFLLQGLGLWTSLLAPRAIDFNATWGNKLSLAANVLMMGSMFLTFGLMGLFEHLGTRTVLAHWWIPPVAAVLAAVFYAATLQTAAVVFCARRERMLSMIEKGFSF